jgi:hypothetical protein
VWNGGKLVGVEPSGRAAYTLVLPGEGDGELTSFDLFTGHLVRVSRIAERAVAIESGGIVQRGRR